MKESQMSTYPYYVKPITRKREIAKPVYTVKGLWFKHTGWKVCKIKEKPIPRVFHNLADTHQADMTRIALSTKVTS